MTDDRFLRGAFGAVRRMIRRPQEDGLLEVAIALELVAPEAGESALQRLTPAELKRLMDEYRRRCEGLPDLPRYEIGERLGEGAASVVYRARDRELGREVALKLLRAEGRTRFEQEARAAAALSHPNVVTLFDAGEAEGRPYLVMELVEGRPLSRVMAERSLDLRALVRILEKAARGAGAAHERGIVHRDLKPANILVAEAGEPKVADFGLARAAAGGLTKAGHILGTPLYMAPEQVTGRPEDVSPRTDVYALGAILFEMLAGRPPHAAAHELEIFRKIVKVDPEPPAGADPALVSVCLKALEKDPARRYPAAAEFADELARWLEGAPIEAKPPSRLRRAWRKVGLPVTGALALFASGLVLFGLPSRKDPLEAKLLRVQAELRDWRAVEPGPNPVEGILSQAQALREGGRAAEADLALDRALLVLRILRKSRAAREGVQRALAEGRDPGPAAQALSEFERRLHSDRLFEAEMILDSALAMLSFTEKMHRVQRKMEQRARQGRDNSAAEELLRQCDPLLRDSRFREAEAVLDRALERLAAD